MTPEQQALIEIGDMDSGTVVASSRNNKPTVVRYVVRDRINGDYFVDVDGLKHRQKADEVWTLRQQSEILDILDAVIAERDDIAAAYAALMRENQMQHQDLETWNTIYAGDRLADQAEGR